MPTLLQLRREVWWNAEAMSPTMQTLAERLRLFYGVGPLNIGAKGDESPGHMQGAHRSRAWILNSIYCTNRSYTVTETPGNRSGGDDNWLAGMDITVPAEQLIPMCQRLDEAVRAGRLEKITEWYGNDDGDNRVDGFDNIRNVVATSDLSHLWHLHLTFDRGRAGEDHSDLFAILTGTEAAPAPQRRLIVAAAQEDEMPTIMVRYSKNEAVFACFGSGLVRHIGPAEFTAYQAEGVELVPTEDEDEFTRLVAAARVAQGYLQ